MEKKAKSITINKDLETQISEQAKKENRNFSNMLETMAIYYLEADNERSN